MQHYDFVIVGAGCAGLSLAYYISLEPSLSKKSILLLDAFPKNKNDRTWCFWHHDTTPFDGIISQQWSAIYVANVNFYKNFDLGKYKYSMIRGIDFYDFVLSTLQNSSNITIQFEAVKGFRLDSNKPCIETDQDTYTCDWVFSSVSEEMLTGIPTDKNKKRFHYLNQHFRGFTIETDVDSFDPDMAGFMDFRTPQEGQARFLYMLPKSKKEALIEFTVFSEVLLDDEDYDKALRTYIKDILKIEDYHIKEIENGCIPMQDAPWNSPKIPKMSYIGTVGGDVKCSTGFAFARIQDRMQGIAKGLTIFDCGYEPSALRPKNYKYDFFDAALLTVMQKGALASDAIFQRLFERHPIERVFRFLDEESSVLEELKIMHNMPHIPFLKAIWTIAWR